jgi:acetoin utilization deacetylase AcuC-like enzyme
MGMKCSAVTGDVFAHHDMAEHAECGERLAIALSGLPKGIQLLEPLRAAIEDIERVHRPQHVRLLREFSRGPGFIDSNTYVSPQSFEVALFAAGSASLAVERAIDGECCFALIRPPGHHAEPERAMGFCLFNNVGVAVAKLLEEHSVDRVAIVDWDLHHGNGTQKIFYNDDRVYFCSIHECGLFPRTGWVDEIGAGRGKGYTLNAPLRPGGTIADYVSIFENIFSPVIERFNPDLIVVSAGQDPLMDDLKGSMKLLPPDFGVLTRIIADLIDQPLAVVLEGGYGPSHGLAISHIFEALGGKQYVADSELARPSTNHLVSLLEKVAL